MKSHLFCEVFSTALSYITSNDAKDVTNKLWMLRKWSWPTLRYPRSAKEDCEDSLDTRPSGQESNLQTIYYESGANHKLK
jgi:hypothetical protein